MFHTKKLILHMNFFFNQEAKTNFVSVQELRENEFHLKKCVPKVFNRYPRSRYFNIWYLSMVHGFFIPSLYTYPLQFRITYILWNRNGTIMLIIGIFLFIISRKSYVKYSPMLISQWPFRRHTFFLFKCCYLTHALANIIWSLYLSLVDLSICSPTRPDCSFINPSTH